MTDPERLLEREGDGLAQELLRAGCDERPSRQSLRRTLVAMGASSVIGSIAGEAAGGSAGPIGAGIVGSTAAKAGMGTVSLVAAKWIAIGGLGGALTIGAASELGERLAARLHGPSSAPPTLAVEHLRSPPSDPSDSMLQREPLQAQLAEPEPALPQGSEIAEVRQPGLAAELRSQPRDPLRSRPMSPAVRGSTGTSVAENSNLARPSSESAAPGNAPPQPSASQLSLRLEREVRLIDSAWSAAKRGDQAQTLRVLAGYETAYPELDLHPEVLFLRMTAEDGLGRIAAARAEASRIVDLYPNSAQASRARALLARR